MTTLEAMQVYCVASGCS